MQEPTKNPTLDQLLDDLRGVLAEEHAALIRMDAEGIEKALAQKNFLNDQLKGHRDHFSPLQRDKLNSIHGDLQRNLILLAHARDFLQNALGINDTRLPHVGRPSWPQVEPSRLDLRG